MLEFIWRSFMSMERWHEIIYWCSFKLTSAEFPSVSLFLLFIICLLIINAPCLTYFKLLVRSQTKDTTSLGCAIAAGRAEGIDLIDFSPQNRGYSVKVHHDTYLPTSTDEDRKARNKKWKMAVERSYGWATTTITSKMTSNLNDSHHDSSSSALLSKLWDNLHQRSFINSSQNPLRHFSHDSVHSFFLSFSPLRWTIHNVVINSYHDVHYRLILPIGFVKRLQMSVKLSKNSFQRW